MSHRDVLVILVLPVVQLDLRELVGENRREYTSPNGWRNGDVIPASDEALGVGPRRICTLRGVCKCVQPRLRNEKRNTQSCVGMGRCNGISIKVNTGALTILGDESSCLTTSVWPCDWAFVVLPLRIHIVSRVSIAAVLRHMPTRTAWND